MADEKHAPEKDQPAKKAPKKLVIVDANEAVEEPTSAPEIDASDSDIVATDLDARKEVPAKKTITIKDESDNEEPDQESKDDVVPAEADHNNEVEAAKPITIGDAIDAASNDEENSSSEDILDVDTEPVAQEAAEAVEKLNEDVEEDNSESDISPEESDDAKEDEFEDTKIAEAVDDIVASEGDELLKNQDELIQKQQEPKEQTKKGGRLKNVFKNWWKNPLTKWGTILLPIISIVTIAVLPVTRYLLLNAAGVRANSSITILSSENQQPLKNVEVALAGATAKTDEKGVASFTKLKLGKTSLKIQKRGYSVVEQTKVLGWGSNPLGQVSLSVTGAQLSFTAKDFLSGKPVVGAEAVSGEFNAQSDADGKILLPIDKDAEGDITVTIKAAEYRDEKVTVKVGDQTEKNVQLVAARKHVFVSKRSGKLELYKIDADGKNEEVLLAGTGYEREDMIVLPHPTKDFIAVSTTRDGVRNSDGYLMSALYVIEVTTGKSTKISQSERIQLMDWTGDRIVFISVTQGASAANPARSKLFSFELGQPVAKELASANYFNDAIVFKNVIYFAPSSYAVPVANVKFFKMDPDGANKKTLLEKEVWNVFRYDYDTLYLSVQQDWYELKSSDSAPAKLSATPANPRSRQYKESPDKKHALWVDTRDGKGVLLSYSVDSKQDEVLQTQAGLTTPVSWLNNTTYVFRVSDGREVADYVRSTQGGEAKKLRDVTNTDFAYYFN